MNDKIKHIIAGVVIALVIGFPAYLESGNLFAGLWSAISGGLVAGCVKEYCDNTYEWVWSWKDLGFTAIGVAIAAAFVLLLHFGKG